MVNWVNVTIDNSTFKNNSAKIEGGAITNFNTGDINIQINNSKFINNSAEKAGAICNDNIQVYISNSILTHNSAKNGGAIYSSIIKPFDSDNLIIHNSNFTNNGAMNGSALYIDSGNVKILNSIFLNNTALNVLLDSDMLVNDFAIFLDYNLISGNNIINAIYKNFVLDQYDINMTNVIYWGLNGSINTIKNCIVHNQSGLDIFGVIGHEIHVEVYDEDNLLWNYSGKTKNSGLLKISHPNNFDSKKLSIFTKVIGNSYFENISNKNILDNIKVLDNLNNMSPIIKFLNDCDGIILLNIANNNYEFYVVERTVNINFPNLSFGDYDYTISYLNDSMYGNFTKYNTLKIRNDISDEDIVISLNDNSNFVKLPNDAFGTISLNINNKNYEFDVIGGIANVKLPDLANGNYEYTLTYSGDVKYASFTKTGSITVNKQTTPVKPVTKTTLTLKTVKVKKSAKKLVLQATLKQSNTPLKGKKIIFKFNGKKYTTKTNKKGIAKVTIKKKIFKKLKVGKKVKYQASYGKIIAKKTVKVKK